VNIRDLAIFEKGSVIDRRALRDRGKIPSLNVSVKLLGDGEIAIPLTVKLEKASQTAIDKIAKAGGTFEQL
jgi:large subunit ribosomal protein L15